MDSNNEISIERSCGIYLVEKIVGVYVGEDNKRYYNVKWADSWEPEDNLSESCQRLIKEFWKEKTIDPLLGKDVSISEIKAGQRVVIKSNKEDKDNFDHPPVDSSSLNVTNRSAESVKVKYTDNNNFKLTDRITKVILIKSEENDDVSKDLSNSKEFVQYDSTVTLSSTSTQTEILALENDKLKSFPEVFENLNKDLASHISETNCKKSQDTTVLDESGNTSTELNCVCLSPKSGHNDISDVSSESISQINFDTEDSSSTLSKTPSFLPINIDCDIDVINLDDDDLEITATLTTPTRKRGRSFSNNTYNNCNTPFARIDESQIFDHSPSRNHNNSFNRMCMTNPVKNTCPIVLNKKPRSCSEERNGNRITSNSMLFHPRRLLHYSSQESESEDYLPSSFQMSKSNEKSQHKKQRPRNQCISKSSLLRARKLKTPGSPTLKQLHTQKNICNTVTSIDQCNNALETSSSNGDTQTLPGRTCNLCNITFNNVTLARRHNNLIHGQKCNSSSSTCTICCGVFRNSRELKSHMLLHGDTEKLYKCDICLLTFKHRSVLNQHLLIHSGDLPYECEICQKRFRQQGHLVTHMAQHDDNMNLTCPRCIIEFPNLSLYSKHMIEHNSELAFHCELCEESFQIKNDLKLHLQAHDDGRPFFCHVCKKSFKTKGYLLGHIHMHKNRVSN
ncbi:zinc finger protein 724 isoform X2 [Hydra vulgaris]|uniref:Zinc finger protein 724 isoform X2 n=1 Tax=Hydra vulgaris TaxID=6087 RepID=A0ABM4DEK1_HYDVU